MELKKFLEFFRHRERTIVSIDPGVTNGIHMAKHRSPTNDRRRRRNPVAVEELVEQKFFAELHSEEFTA